MKRRKFIKLIGGVAASWPLAAHAQSDQIRRVAVILAEAIEDDPEYERRLSAFKDAFHDLGWIDGKNVKLSVHRAKPGAADIRKGVAELLAENPEIIVSGGGTTILPVLQATNSVAVVFATAVDPVGNGFVESLSHPGGNATGFMTFDYSLSAKWLELLKQASPSTVRVGVIRDAAAPSGTGQFAVIQSVAGSVGAEVVPIGLRDASEIESGVAKLAAIPNTGLIATVGAAVIGNRDLILRLATQYRLPAVYPSRTYVDHGGLISYGADPVKNYRSAAGYVDRILKGEKPADLPVQAPNKYDLVVNLKTAKSLGIGLPATLLARTDEVIE